MMSEFVMATMGYDKRHMNFMAITEPLRGTLLALPGAGDN
jgi:hypothetical protein